MGGSSETDTWDSIHELEEETTYKMLENQLSIEQEARTKAEESAKAVEEISNQEIRRLGEDLEKAQREADEVRKQAGSGKCAIMMGGGSETDTWDSIHELEEETTDKMLENQLSIEQEARTKAEESAKAVEEKSNQEIRRLSEDLEKAQREADEVRKQAGSGKCAIM